MNDDLDFHPHSQDLNFPYQVSRKVVRNHYKNDNTNMEIFDIKNIPVNKLFMISVNVNMNMLEIYFNDKLRQIFYLDGIAKFNKTQDLYALETLSLMSFI